MEHPLPIGTPHLRVQTALAKARAAGATEATLTIHPGNRTATLDDNRNPGVLHSEIFDMELPGRAASQWDPHHRLRQHVVPAGLHATLVSTRSGDEPSQDHLTALGENELTTRPTSDGRYMVHLTHGRRLTQTTILNPDGTSRGMNTHHANLAIRHTADRHPGTEAGATQLSSIAEPLHQDQTGPTTSDIVQILETTVQAAAYLMAAMDRDSGGHVWPNNQLAAEIADLALRCPDIPRPPKGPSTSAYTVHLQNGQNRAVEAITPPNAVVLQNLVAQSRSLTRSIREHAPRDFLAVHSDDPTIPTLSLIGARVTALTGEIEFHRPTGAEPGSNRHRERLSHSRVERVSEISLEMQLTVPGQQDHKADVFTFNTDALAHRDGDHHLLLITQEAQLTLEDLRAIIHLSDPKADDLPERAKEAFLSDPQEWYETYVITQLLHGSERAAQQALETLAALADFLHLGSPATATPHTLTADSPSGRVTITLNPPPTGGFVLPSPSPDFERANLADLDPSTLFTVTTTEYPGAIQPGHILRYSTLDQKLQTVQPHGTPVTNRVHPLTVTPSLEPANAPLWQSQDARWAVMERGYRHLILAPLTKPQA